MTITFSSSVEPEHAHLCGPAEDTPVMEIAMHLAPAQLLPDGWRFNYSRKHSAIFADFGRFQRKEAFRFHEECPVDPMLLGPIIRDYLNNFTNPNPPHAHHGSN